MGYLPRCARHESERSRHSSGFRAGLCILSGAVVFLRAWFFKSELSQEGAEKAERISWISSSVSSAAFCANSSLDRGSAAPERFENFYSRCGSLLAGDARPSPTGIACKQAPTFDPLRGYAIFQAGLGLFAASFFSSTANRVRRGSLVSLALAGIAALHGAVAPMNASPELMPLPRELRLAEGRLPIAMPLRVAISGPASERLHAAVDRMALAWSRRTGVDLPVTMTAPADATLAIEFQRTGAMPPRLGEDESYTLEIDAKRAVLHAATDVGALRGVATLQQALVSEASGCFLPAMRVSDAPRFPWRGLMIDVARHWQPMAVIERNLDGMALVKLNVLHLHLTEDQGFRIESRTHPELHERGSDGHFFTQAEMRELIAYAAARGIRVVPEFDMPGHATSWVVSHPELASAPGPYAIERKWGVFDPVLDPTNEKTYALLADFLGEMAALFPDDYLHIGGDENNGVQWNANARIQAFIREHDLKDNAGLHAYFNRRIGAILREHGKKLVGWDEILHPDLPKDSVIHSWRGPTALAEAARLGYSGLLSNGYYIDLNHPASEHYLNDPLPAGTKLTAEEQQRILGGEATMWAEWVTPELIDTRIWPRTAAIAERLWSPREVRDVTDMYRRLGDIDLRLQEAGVQQGAWPRIDLPGIDPRGSVAEALRTLAAAVEPVKDYQRGGLQPDTTQQTPLIELADWARPDSTTAREFRAAVDRWLFGAGALDARGATEAIVAQLETWRAAGELGATAPAGTSAREQARGEVARQLAAISGAGLDAIAALIAGRPLEPERRERAGAALDAAAKPTAAAVEFPALASLRVLVAATAKPERREEISRDAWRRELEASVTAAGKL